jgi:hypothetical protein
MANLFLALADVHGEAETLGYILKENTQVKGIFLAGDVTNFGHEKEAERVLSTFARLAPDTKLFFVAGNCDTPGARRFFERQAGYLERKCAVLGMGCGGQAARAATVHIIGCGGGLLHTGLTPFEISDEEMESGLRQAYEQCAPKGRGSPLPSQAPPLVVLTHTPPRDTFADMRHMKHFGSTAFASFLYEYGPLLWICGHIHESRSVQREGKTLVINPGPAAHGSYALILIEERMQGGLQSAAELRAI